MNLSQTIKNWAVRALGRWRLWCKSRIRTIDNRYFSGFRRLADTREEAAAKSWDCSYCRNATCEYANPQNFRNWFCGRAMCLYQPCHNKEDLSKADLAAGEGKWIPVEKEEISRESLTVKDFDE